MQHNILFQKMRGLNCTSSIIRSAKSFLEDRSQRVVVQDTKSSTQTINVGVPQGTISGPMFWLLFADNLQLTTSVYMYNQIRGRYNIIHKYQQHRCHLPRSNSRAKQEHHPRCLEL
eukprot:GHVO01037455.1.p2 GENE.GHVO01037455.1~~GHVO01037455.1.p2  ORF type:complete len:116 (-),score=0.23 GHVO01037455.1:442-789(-)